MTIQKDAPQEKTPVELVQELYDASTMLLAVLGFTYETADLLSPDLDYACRRVMAARAAVRRAGFVQHVDAGLLDRIVLPSPFDVPAAKPRKREAAHG